MEDRDRIVEMIDGADMLFITAGMGGGTGTGAAPVVAQRREGAGHPDRRRGHQAVRRSKAASACASRSTGIEELGKHVDSLITIPNEKLLDGARRRRRRCSTRSSAANDVLHGAVQGIAELITRPGPRSTSTSPTCAP